MKNLVLIVTGIVISICVQKLDLSIISNAYADSGDKCVAFTDTVSDANRSMNFNYKKGYRVQAAASSGSSKLIVIMCK